MRYKLAIFDLDGTLLNTLAGLTAALNAARRMNGLAPQTDEQVRSFIGNGIVKLVERSLDADPGYHDDEIVQRLVKDNASYYDSHCLDKTFPYNGIAEVLRRIKSAGMHLAVVSNKNDEPTQILMNRFFDGVFEFVTGSREDVPRKPDPTGVQMCMDYLDCTPDETVYIGDSDVDIMTADNAGIDIISCAWGFKGREFLRENGAVNICSDPLDLWRLLQ